LKVDAKQLPTVRLGDADKAEVGENIFVISSPQGLENTISNGILSGIREIEPKKKILQITAPISAGSSGGAVFNKNGEVIGIATFLIKESHNVNFAMPINLIKGKIDSQKLIALKEAETEDFEKTAEYWFLLGYNFEMDGLYDKAIEAYKKAIRINPYLEGAHNNLGTSYGKLGMHEEAIEAFKKALRINADNDWAYYNLGTAYNNLSMHKEAIEAFKKAIRIKPHYVEAYYNLGTSYGKLGKYKEAVEAFKQAVRIKPDLVLAHYNLGITYLFLKDKNSALEQYKILKTLELEIANKFYNQIYE